jgi:signal peptidase I
MSKAAHADQAHSPAVVMRSVKQTIEHLVVAFILAFVFRAYFAEAYRIPTGSMAPTLLGSHMSRMCPDCGYEYTYDASIVTVPGRGPICQLPRSNVCPNCGASDMPLPVIRNGKSMIEGGDRILVMKLGYELGELFPSIEKSLGPKRWDAVVFKNPADPNINFIKRLIGLPGEKIEIIDGDIYANDVLARKSDAAQQSLWFIVHDTDYQPTHERRFAETIGWAPATAADKELWTRDDTGRVMVFHGLEKTSAVGTLAFTGSVTDYNAYDDPDEQRGDAQRVSDLKISGVLVIRDGTGIIELAMGKRDSVFVAQIDTQRRQATLLRANRVNYTSGNAVNYETLSTIRNLEFPLKTPIPIEFENVDYRVTLRIAGEPVVTTTDEQYAPDVPALRALRMEPNPPLVRINASGMDAQLWHLKLFRDIYYRYTPQMEKRAMQPDGSVIDNPLYGRPGHGVMNSPIALGENDLFVLGDNSLKSKDSRLWWEVGPHLEQRYETGRYQLGTVPRDQMVGRAVFVYWPSGYRLLGSGPMIVPNVGDMRFIR